MFTSLKQCHGCRLTWFPQGRNPACPACGGTRLGGTFELFHAGLLLIALGSIGWVFRHGPLSERTSAAEPVAVHATSVAENNERRADAHVPAKKTKPDKVNVKRRQKKAKTRSKHVQR
ncbi:MAG TPA: hypothetical protein VG496_00650 [Myxococcales bacterium]|nr:hypothetical protein [Myxococcales bacterium]